MLLALAFPNFNLPLLAWVAIAPLIVASLDGGLGEAALRGLLFGAAFFVFSTPWIYTVMHQYGPMPSSEAAGVMTLMILAASPYFVAFTLLMVWIARRGKGLAVFASPFLWVALELGRARMPDIAFPWNLSGYAASGNLALVQLTSVTGIYGLSLIVAAYNAMVVWLAGCALGWLKRPRGQALSHAPGGALAALTALVLGVALIGPRFVPAAQASQVAHLVQPDLPQSMEYPANWGAIHAGDMAELDRLSIAAGQKEPRPGGLAGSSGAVFADRSRICPARANDRARFGERFPAGRDRLGARAKAGARPLQQRRAARSRGAAWNFTMIKSISFLSANTFRGATSFGSPRILRASWAIFAAARAMRWGSCPAAGSASSSVTKRSFRMKCGSLS